MPNSPGPRAHPSELHGTIVSVAASIAFGALYFATPMLAPLSSETIVSIRVLTTLVLLTALLLLRRRWWPVIEISSRVRRNPALILGLAACGCLLAAQLWLFAWAPFNGRGLQVALGYFLLPLVLVVVGRLLYGDRLQWWQWLACAAAAVGVVFEVFRVGSVSWETLLVALGYPVYFVLRRSIGTGHLAGMWWEFLALAPVAAALLVHEFVRGSAFAQNPSLWWVTPAFSALAGLAIVLYVAASRMLSMSLFGLLSYVEPALLVVASVLLGERITAGEWFTYGAVWTAVLILVVGGAVQIRGSRR